MFVFHQVNLHISRPEWGFLGFVNLSDTKRGSSIPLRLFCHCYIMLWSHYLILGLLTPPPFILEVTAIHQTQCFDCDSPFEFSMKCGQLSSGSLEGAHLHRLHRKLTDLLAGRGDRKPRSCFAEKWNRLFFRERFVWIDIKLSYILVHLSAFDKKWAAAGVEPLRDEVSNSEQLACAKLTLS